MKKTLPNNNFYSTSSLVIASAISLWFPIEKINRDNPKRVEFLFKKSKELEKLLDLYWKQKLFVEVQAYFNQIKSIKTRIYEDR